MPLRINPTTSGVLLHDSFGEFATRRLIAVRGWLVSSRAGTCDPLIKLRDRVRVNNPPSWAVVEQVRQRSLRGKKHIFNPVLVQDFERFFDSLNAEIFVKGTVVNENIRPPVNKRL